MYSFRAAWLRAAGRGLCIAGITRASVLTQNRTMLRAVTPETP